MITKQDLRNRATSIARTTLAPVPLAFWENIFPKDVIALCYHIVSDYDLPHLQLYPYKDPAQFEADVIFARTRAVTYREVVDRRLRGSSLPANGILFTFDDGLIQCYDVVRPILQKHGVDAVFFVTTDYLDDSEPFFECALSLCLSTIALLDTDRARLICNDLEDRGVRVDGDPIRATRSQQRAANSRLIADVDPWRKRLLSLAFGLSEGDSELGLLIRLLEIDLADYVGRNPIFMTREAVRQLSKAGFTIGAHGRKHRSLESLSAEDLEKEIVASCEAVRDITGQERVPFAFPYSGVGIDRKILAKVLERNRIVEMIFDSGCLRNDPNFIVNRVFADEPTSTLPKNASNVRRTLRKAWSAPSAWFRNR